jgi:hypothetical protein
MKSKLKEEVMDAVGELPDFGNLLLRESGYPHLKDTSAWNDATTKPATSGVYETSVKGAQTSKPMYQLWTGSYWDYPTSTIESAERPFGKSRIQDVEWREVQ